MLRNLFRTSVIALLTMVFSSRVTAAQDLVRVFVQACSGGLAANGANDSAIDVRKAIQNRKGLQVVDSVSLADIVVRIDSRSERKDPGATHTYARSSDDGKSASATTSQSTNAVKVVHATLLAGSFQTPLEGEDILSWRSAAGNIASDVEHWAKENNSKVMERREGVPTGNDATPASSVSVPTSKAQDASIVPGMTEKEVLAALGTPDKRVTFGQKAMWNYRGMQVVFTSGRVSDVKF